MISKKLALLAGIAACSSMSLGAMQSNECEKLENKRSWLPLYFCTKQQDLGFATFHIFKLFGANPSENNTFYPPKIGSATAFCEDENSCELSSLSITPQLENQGWGSWFLQKTLSFLKTKNYKSLSLMADPIRQSAWYGHQIKFESMLLNNMKNTEIEDCKDYGKQLCNFNARDNETAEKRLLNFYKKNGGQQPKLHKKKPYAEKIFVFNLNKSK